MLYEKLSSEEIDAIAQRNARNSLCQAELFSCALHHRKIQQRQRIRLVVVLRVEPDLPGGGYHRVLAGVSLAGGVLFDRSHRHSLIRYLMMLTPGRQMGHKAPVSVRGIYSGMTPYLLEIDGVYAVCASFGVSQPSLELEESHPAALEPARFEGL